MTKKTSDSDKAVAKKVTKEATKKATETKKAQSGFYGFVDRMCARWRKKKQSSKKWKTILTAVECLALSLWVIVSFKASTYIVNGILLILMNLGVDFSGANETVLLTVFDAITYVLVLAVTVFVPWVLLKEKTTRDELGLRGLVTWTDIGLGVVGFVVAMIAIFIVTMIVSAICPWIDMEEAQDVGFENLTGFGEMMLAFITLVVIAPVFEEIVFRGWLYGKLRARTWAMPAIILTSVMFGVAHGQWNVGVTVGVMSVIMCMIRELTGTVWGSMIVHMLKNGIAFYFLFVWFR